VIIKLSKVPISRVLDIFLLEEILTPGSESRNLLKKMGKINNEIIIRKHREPSRGHE
jgi:hypothetical protein